MRFLYLALMHRLAMHTHRRERGKKPNKEEEREGKERKGKPKECVATIQLLTNFVGQKR